MKAWRRTVSDNQLSAGVTTPFLTDLGGETVEVSNVAEFVGTHFVKMEVALDPGGPFVDQQETPLSVNPQVIDMAGAVGLYTRAAMTIGDGIPVTPWSNIVQVTA